MVTMRDVALKAGVRPRIPAKQARQSHCNREQPRARERHLHGRRQTGLRPGLRGHGLAWHIVWSHSRARIVVKR